MRLTNLGNISNESDLEVDSKKGLLKLLKNNHIPDDELLDNLGLFLTSKTLSRILFMHHIYQQIIDVPGVIMEFGTRWGQNSHLFSMFRSMYEPFNRHKKVIAFDTFEGFPDIDKKDGNSKLMKKNSLNVPDKYELFLDKVFKVNEKLNPLDHIKKYEIIKGDATITVKKYLEDNPQTIIAMAYFDFDIYKPTKIVLEQIKSRLVKGSLLAFDELNDKDAPGETLALMEVFGLNNIKLKRLPITSRTSYFIVE